MHEKFRHCDPSAGAIFCRPSSSSPSMRSPAAVATASCSASPSASCQIACLLLRAPAHRRDAVGEPWRSSSCWARPRSSPPIRASSWSSRPSAIFAIGCVMLKRGWMARYLPPIVARNVRARLLVFWGYAWAALMFVLAAANLSVAFLAGPEGLGLVHWRRAAGQPTSAVRGAIRSSCAPTCCAPCRAAAPAR